jgi:hypothetical protein
MGFSKRRPLHPTVNDFVMFITKKRDVARGIVRCIPIDVMPLCLAFTPFKRANVIAWIELSGALTPT